MAVNTKKPAEFSETDIEAFQQKEDNKSRGKVQYMEFERDEDSDDADKPARFWVAKPSRTQMGVIAGVAEKDQMKGNDLLLNTCVLAGDVAELVNDTNMYFGVLREINALTEAKKKL